MSLPMTSDALVAVTPAALAFALNMIEHRGAPTPSPKEIARAANILHIAMCEDARSGVRDWHNVSINDTIQATHAPQGI